MQNSKTLGECVTCHRYSALTRHHLIPKKRHKKKNGNDQNQDLNEMIWICRKCHDGIHDLYNEQTLANRLNTLEKLIVDEKLKKHFRWVSKCKKGIR
jgi:5-methylcytosine-specific restriction endonuclease McrA